MPEKDKKKTPRCSPATSRCTRRPRKMDSRNQNKKLHYEGDVLMWQGANRIQADVGGSRPREAHPGGRWKRGDAISGSSRRTTQKKKTATPVLTEVRAPHLVYTEADRLAVYTGGAALKRPNLQVNSRPDLRLPLRYRRRTRSSRRRLPMATSTSCSPPKPSPITAPRSTASSTWTSKRSSCWAASRAWWTITATTVGPGGLTYYVNDDRLLVIGSDNQPASSRLKREKSNS